MKYRFWGGLFLVFSMLSAKLTGRAESSLTPGQVVWSYASGYTNLVDFAVSKDGRVYLGYSDTTAESVLNEYGFYIVTLRRTNQLVALQHTGVFNWERSDAGQYLALLSDGTVVSSFSDIRRRIGMHPTGNIYYGTYATNNFYIYNQAGGLEHHGTTGGRAAVNADDSLLVVNLQKYPYSAYPADVARIEGNEHASTWLSSQDHVIGETPVISPDGTFYLTSWGSTEPLTLPSGDIIPNDSIPPILFAYNSDGSRKWSLLDESFNVGYGTPSIGSDGTLYVASYRSLTNRAPDWSIISVEKTYHFKAVSPEGALKWSVEKAEPFGLAAIGETNNIYVCHGTKLLALTSSGTERWSYDAEAPLKLCPALAADGTVYVATEPGKLLAINSEVGSKEWEYDAGKPIYNSPVIGTNGNVYLLVDRADMVVLKGNAEAANVPWPMERHDAQRTSRAVQASAREIGRNEEGQVTLMLNVEPGRDYKVEASEDFVIWTEIGSFTSTSTAKSFLDETSADKPKRFYRLVVP